MTVTSELTYRKTKEDNREWRATSVGGSNIRSQVKRLKHLSKKIVHGRSETEEKGGFY